MAIKTNQTPADSGSPVNQRLNKSGPLNYILFFLVIGLVVYGFFLSFDQGRILTSTSDLEKQTKDIQTQIDTIKSNKVEVSQNAAEALEKIKAEEIRWSEVISEVDQLIPQDALGNQKISVLSYSGSGNGKVSLNMVTQPAALPSFEEVARVLTIFNGSVFFQDAYVPSIAKSTNENGEITLSFVLTTDYKKVETGSESLPVITSVAGNEATDSVPADTATIKVPRNN